jgi:thiol-disulfide isomerase/thioredoxin
MIRNLFCILLSLGLAFGCGRSKKTSGDQRVAAPAASQSAGPSVEHAAAAAHAMPTSSAAAAGGAMPTSSATAAGESEFPRGIEPLEIGPFLGRLAELGKRGTLVNAFASWCGPCREEVPMLEAMAPHLARDGIALVFVSFDEPEDRAKAESFLRANNVRSPAFLALDGLTFRTRLAPKWPGMIPATFLLDHTRKLRYFWGGPAYEHEIVPIVEGFVAGRAIDGESSFSLSTGRTE